MKMIDLTGQRFGRLTVVRHAGKSAHGSIMWKCQSDCGKRKTIAGSSLRRGLTRSCGCLFSERLVAFNRSPEHKPLPKRERLFVYEGLRPAYSLRCK
jgi:hypothetical protein